jgi:colicin import membrane protein
VKRAPGPPAAQDRPRQPGGIRAVFLAVVVHAAFFALIVFGVTWQSRQQAPLQAELWKDLPPAPKTTKAPEPEPPKPDPEPPKPEPPKPEPPKPEPPKELKKDEPPKPDPAIALKEKKEREKKERLEKLEREKRKKDEEAAKKKKEDEARKKKEDEARRREEERVKREQERARAARNRMRHVLPPRPKDARMCPRGAQRGKRGDRRGG